MCSSTDSSASCCRSCARRGVPIAVVNASGRIVTSTDSRREPGSMLRLEGLDDALAPLREPEPPSGRRRLPGGAEVIACGDTSLALVVGL